MHKVHKAAAMEAEDVRCSMGPCAWGGGAAERGWESSGCGARGNTTAVKWSRNVWFAVFSQDDERLRHWQLGCIDQHSSPLNLGDMQSKQTSMTGSHPGLQVAPLLLAMHVSLLCMSPGFKD